MSEVLSIKDFAVLRHKIWLRKSYGYPLPQEQSAILDQHHYTNIWRELDRNSVYLFNSVQRVWLGNLNQTIADTIRFRLFNKIETNEALIEKFGSLDKAFDNADDLYDFLKSRKANFTGAYVRCPDLKLLCEETQNKKLKPIVNAIEEALLNDSAKEVIKLLRSIFSIGDFLADQLLMDLTWIGGQFDTQIQSAGEYFAPNLGPGAKAGLKHCIETGQGDFNQLLDTLQKQFDSLPMPTVNSQPVKFDARALEHTLCEYFKHVKFQQRNGKPVKMRVYKSNGEKRNVAILPWSWDAPKVKVL